MGATAANAVIGPPLAKMKHWLTVVGMGDDGPEGLAPAARLVVEHARVLVGGQRHLDLLGPGEQREHIPGRSRSVR